MYAACALFCLSIALLLHSEATALRERGLTASGTFVAVSSEWAKTPWVDIEYRAQDGRQLIAEDVEVFRREPWPKVGDPVRVLYDPLDPQNAIDETVGLDSLGAVWWGIAFVSLAVASLLTACGRARFLWAPGSR